MKINEDPARESKVFRSKIQERNVISHLGDKNQEAPEFNGRFTKFDTLDAIPEKQDEYETKQSFLKSSANQQSEMLKFKEFQIDQANHNNQR